MKKMSLPLLLGVLLVSIFLIAGCNPATEGEQAKQRIGIMQIADHPALNAARDGFIEAPVSYTHLDVYKRQTCTRAPAVICPQRKQGSTALPAGSPL